MLHPRVPPLVRALPHVETLSLFRAEESLDETETRRGLGLVTNEEAQSAVTGATASATVIAAEAVTINATPAIAPSAVSPTVQPSLATSTAQNATAAVAYAAANRSRANVTSAAPPAVNVQTAAMDAPKVPEPRPSGSVSLPPPPEPLPSSSKKIAAVSVPQVSTIVSAEQQAMPVTMQIDPHEDDDESMPGIDLGSDSEEE